MKTKFLFIVAILLCLALNTSVALAAPADLTNGSSTGTAASTPTLASPQALATSTGSTAASTPTLASTPTPAGGQAAPTITVNKTVDPSTIAPGGQATVTLTVTAGAAGQTMTSPGYDVMLVLDTSGSMSSGPGSKMQGAIDASNQLVDKLALGTDQAGVVTFDSSATLAQQLTTDPKAVHTAINNSSSGGSTNISDGIDTAQAELNSSRHKPANQPVIVLLSDGDPNSGSGDPVQAAKDSASLAKAAGTRVITIALGSDADQSLMKSLASSAGDFFFAPTAADLSGVFASIAKQISGSVNNVVATDVLSDLATLVPGSFTINPDTFDGKNMTWNIGTMSSGQTWTVQYKITMSQSGYAGDFPKGKATFDSTDGLTGEAPFPPVYVTVATDAQQPTVEPFHASMLPNTGFDGTFYLAVGFAMMALGATALRKGKAN